MKLEPALLDRRGRLEKHRRNLLAKGDRAFASHNFTASVTLPAYVSGVFRVRLFVFILGALVSGAFFIALYEGLSYLFGEEVAKRIGDAGSKAVLGVLVAVAVGLGLRVAWSRWRTTGRSDSVNGRPRLLRSNAAVRDKEIFSSERPRGDRGGVRSSSRPR
jgi:membrane protein DedA with SNARE-associated domain